MKKILISGANKGIGLETAWQLIPAGNYAYLGSRDLDNGLRVAELLKQEGLTALEAVKLDVTRDESVRNARQLIGKKTAVLDVLINNAGLSWSVPARAPLPCTVIQITNITTIKVRSIYRPSGA
ncbi:MAG: SDR family NAD(P)-dependent oxidoreductase [Sphingobacterium sp.]